MKKGYLILENGRIFEGERFGADCECIGELVFTTGMGGYIETLTDPGYYGQIIMQTFPLMGNFGWIPEDAEGKRCHARGYVVREWCDTPSNFRCKGTLDDYLKSEGIPAICGVDTREITKIIREEGVMSAVISDCPDVDISALRQYRITDAVKNTCPCKDIVYPAVGEALYNVTLIDYGSTGAIAQVLCKKGCTVTVRPYDTAAEDILAAHPDGVILSDGAGDPTENTAAIAEIKKLAGAVPVFAIGLGHQMLALALGGRTAKLKYGHRGANQPVKDITRGKVMITCQNHGYTVERESLGSIAEERFVNVNDGTCEGLAYPAHRAFSVQFSPEACNGPINAQHLFGDFVSMMGGKN